MPVTSIRIKSEIEKPLELLANKLHRSNNYLINQAIKEFIKRQEAEDIQWIETLEALDSVKSGRGVDEQEVNSWLSSWGTTKEKPAPKA
ncbi:MAG: ribbon-helix-helix protein, CopG family [Gammaproteobacteria bacterium]|nr:MAG: ribbon-helix-helix protein, CopG family [Gammaproteobacteria bacterium]